MNRIKSITIFMSLIFAFLIIPKCQTLGQEKKRNKTLDSVSIINRIHRNLYKNIKPYQYLFNKYWAVDTFTKDSILRNKPDFIILPIITYAPETNLKFGLASAYSFFTHNDPITRVSTQTAKISYSLDHQYGIELNPDFWLKGNAYHFTGAFQYIAFPAYYYGIGSNTLLSNKVLLNSHEFYLNLEAEKTLFTNFRIGLSLTSVRNNYNFSSNNTFFQKNPNLYALTGGTSFFTGISLIYDSRNRLNYTTQGTYIKLNSGINLNGISNLNTMQQVNFSAVEYIPLSKKSTIGFNIVSNNVFGKQIPFYLLNQLGGSNIERGYYTGRFRDKSLLAAQAEFKYHIIPRLAFGVFAGTGTVWGNSIFSFSEFKPSLGGGVRYVFSIPNQLTFRLDYGIGEKPTGEPRLHGAYFALSEAF